MFWLRTVVAVIGRILNSIKELNVTISFNRFNRQMGLNCSDFFIDLSTSTITTRQRYSCAQLQTYGQTQALDRSVGTLTFQRTRSDAARWLRCRAFSSLVIFLRMLTFLDAGISTVKTCVESSLRRRQLSESIDIVES